MSVLDELVAGAVQDQADQEKTTCRSLRSSGWRSRSSAPIDARQWLKKADGIPVIAEIKRASPSKGHLSDISRIGPLWPANTSREVQARFPC